MDIPEGWERVTTGGVRVGDKLWSTSGKKWIDVTPGTMNDLGFLDAQSVDELVCVIRPCSSVG